MPVITNPPPFDPVQFQMEAFSQLSAANVQYLEITVGALFALATLGTGVFYFFNIRPFFARLKQQEKSLADLKKEIDSQITSMAQKFTDQSIAISEEKNLNENRFTQLVEEQEKSLTGVIEKIELAEAREKKEFESLREQSKTLYDKVKGKIEEVEIFLSWNAHYMWNTDKTYTNELSNLLETIEKIHQYNKMTWLYKLALEEVSDCLIENKEELLKRKERTESILRELYSLIEKIKFDEECKKIIDTIKASVTAAGFKI